MLRTPHSTTESHFLVYSNNVGRCSLISEGVRHLFAKDANILIYHSVYDVNESINACYII
jgi:hypothetical protein